MFTTKVQTEGAIPWSDLLKVLTQLNALSVVGDATLAPGSRIYEVRKEYPACDPKLIQLIHKAAERLRELQDPDQAASTDGEEVLSEFNDYRQALWGPTP